MLVNHLHLGLLNRAFASPNTQTHRSIILFMYNLRFDRILLKHQTHTHYTAKFHCSQLKRGTHTSLIDQNRIYCTTFDRLVSVFFYDCIHTKKNVSPNIDTGMTRHGCVVWLKCCSFISVVFIFRLSRLVWHVFDARTQKRCMHPMFICCRCAAA